MTDTKESGRSAKSMDRERTSTIMATGTLAGILKDNLKARESITGLMGVSTRGSS